MSGILTIIEYAWNTHAISVCHVKGRLDAGRTVY